MGAVDGNVPGMNQLLGALRLFGWRGESSELSTALYRPLEECEWNTEQLEHVEETEIQARIS